MLKQAACPNPGQRLPSLDKQDVYKRQIEERLLQAIEAGRALDLDDEELIEMMRTLLESDD